MVCNKCGRPVSSRLSRPIPLCMRCRYQAMRQGAPSVAKKNQTQERGEGGLHPVWERNTGHRQPEQEAVLRPLQAVQKEDLHTVRCRVRNKRQ